MTTSRLNGSIVDRSQLTPDIKSRPSRIDCLPIQERLSADKPLPGLHM